jgi:hypothetical protein
MAKWLDTVSVMHPSHRNGLYLLVKLANTSEVLPQQIIVTVTNVDPFPWFKGATATVHFGQCIGHNVVVKKFDIATANLTVSVHISTSRCYLIFSHS